MTRLAQTDGGASPPPSDGDTAELGGSVERVTYSDASSLYLVLRVVPEKGYAIPQSSLPFRPATVTAVGRAPAPSEGLRVRLSGSWTNHKTHGLQFEFDQLEVLPPRDAEGLVKYLASSSFEGVGETLAQRIVAKLGPEALERILTDPACLEGIRGLRGAVREKLIASLALEIGTHKTLAFLRGLGLGPWQATAVARKLGPDCEALVRADPWRLAHGIAGIGFATADGVAVELGIATDDPRRLRAALVAGLRAAADDGHTLQRRDVLVERTRTLLRESEHPLARIEDAELTAELAELERHGEVVLEEDDDVDEPAVYLPGLAHCERTLARNVSRLLAAAPLEPLASADDLRAAEARGASPLDDDQRAAVLGLLGSPIALLTGGPGVGKTTIVRWIVTLAENAGSRVRLASPTGRAAKRLAEATGRDAQTLHRTLGWDPSKEDGSRFLHDRKNPLDADFVVVDEISMLDVALAHHLLEAVQPPTRLVLVGDPDQLPSVGPGNVLAELLASERVPTHRLTRIYRQEGGGYIVQNAHRILQGEMPELPERGDRGADFYLFPADDPARAADRVIEVVTRRIPETFGLDWLQDVQVIAPMYKGDCGVDALNARLREELDPQSSLTPREVRQGARVWRVGDRVIQTRNDYDKEVFNGDMGRIRDIAADGSATVAYPERDVVYGPTELSALQPAFAITVHRSQGGEFPAVVVPLVMQHRMMLRRNLLYTAVTRARKLVVLVGSPRALRTAVEDATTRERDSRLARRLRDALPEPPATASPRPG